MATAATILACIVLLVSTAAADEVTEAARLILADELVEARLRERPVALAFVAPWSPESRHWARTELPRLRSRGVAARCVWRELSVDAHVNLARELAVEDVPQTVIVGDDGRIHARIHGAVAAEVVETQIFAAQAVALGLERPPTLSATGPSTRLAWDPGGYRSFANAIGHVGYGPLALSSQSPFQSLRLTMVPRAPSTLARGQIELRVQGTWANIWSEGGHGVLDYEMLQGRASIDVGASDAVQLGLAVEQRSRFGGVMDAFIAAFHDTFGFEQNGRDTRPRGEFLVELPADGVHLDEDDRGVFTRSVEASLQHLLSPGGVAMPALSWSLIVRGSANDDLDPGLDVGLSLSAARRFGEIYGYLGLGWTWFGSESFQGVRLDRTQASGLAAIEWRYALRRAVILQYLVTEGAAEDGPGPFDEASHEITLGWKAELNDGFVLELGLIENLFIHDNSPDFGAFVGIALRR